MKLLIAIVVLHSLAVLSLCFRPTAVRARVSNGAVVSTQDLFLQPLAVHAPNARMHRFNSELQASQSALVSLRCILD